GIRDVHVTGVQTCALPISLIISYPEKIKENKRESALVELIDLAPTLLEAAGIDKYPGMQGKSLWPLIQGEEHNHREDVYCEVNEARVVGNTLGNGSMISTKSHK